MKYVLITVLGEIIDQVVFYYEPSSAVRQLANTSEPWTWKKMTQLFTGRTG